MTVRSRSRWRVDGGGLSQGDAVEGIVDALAAAGGVGGAAGDALGEALGVGPAGAGEVEGAVGDGEGLLEDGLLQPAGVGNGELRRGGGRGRPQVGDEVGEGDVGLVADGADDGMRAGVDGPCDGLVVEGHELFGGAAAAGDDHCVDVGLVAEDGEGLEDGGDGAVALNAAGDQRELDEREAPPDDVLDVVPDRAGGGGDDGDAPREGGMGRLRAWSKRPSASSLARRRSSSRCISPRPWGRTMST